MAAADTGVQRGSARRWWVRALLWLPVLVCVLGTAAAVVGWWATSYDVYGDPMSPAAATRARVLVVAAVVCGVGVPLVGSALSAATGSARWRRRYVAALVAGCIPAGVLLATAQPEPPPVPAEREVICQERSGGDTDCPGG